MESWRTRCSWSFHSRIICITKNW